MNNMFNIIFSLYNRESKKDGTVYVSAIKLCINCFTYLVISLSLYTVINP